MTFEEWLENKFGENYSGTKDGYEDDMERWFEQLDVQELLDYGTEYGNYRVLVKH